MPSPATARELDPQTLKDAIVARLPNRSQTSGELRLPAIPELLSHYTGVLLDLFAGLGYRFTPADQADVRARLGQALQDGFAASAYSKVLIKYHSAGADDGVNYEITREVITLEDEYADWTRNRKPPLFGANPDAKVMSMARALGPSAEVAVLDVGAGTGRNTLPLARAGFRVDAVELSSSLAALLRTELQNANVSAQVFEGDALDPDLPVPRGAYKLVVLAEVVASHFRDVAQLRQLFVRASEWLAPGGVRLFSGILASDGYTPDGLAKQASQAFWCCLFTRAELQQAAAGLPFERVSDESCYSFERKHLPQEAWPPTGWFERWARGQDLFELPQGKPPHELRWMAYRRTPHAAASSSWPTASALVHVRASLEQVWAALVDPQRASRLFRPALPLPGIAERSSFAADGGEPTPGAQRRNVWTDGSVTQDELLTWEPQLHFSYRWTNTLRGPLALLFRSAISDWTLTPTENGTSVYWNYRVEPRFRPIARLINIVQGAFERWMRASLQSLQKSLEPKKQS